MQTINPSFGYYHGVLGRDGLYIVGRDDIIPVDFASYAELAPMERLTKLSALHGLQSIWLVANHEWRLFWLPGEFPPESDRAYYYWTSPLKEKFGAVTLTLASGRKLIVVNTAIEQRWPFLAENNLDPERMRQVMYGILRAFKSPFLSVTPSGQALPYLFESLGSVKAGDTSGQFAHLKALDLVWKMPGLHPKMFSEVKYVHFADCNSAYLAAAARVELGIGEPVLVDSMQADTRMPAFYRGNYIIRPSEWLNPFDNEVNPAQQVEKRGEYEASLWRLAQARDIPFTIDGGVIWPEYKRALRKYAESLWQARQECPIDLPGLAQSIKMAALAGLGRLSNSRPDWYATIIAETRRSCVNHIRAALGQKEPFCIPVAWYVDCGVFLSQEPDITKALPSLMSKPDSLGGYKHKATIALTPDVAQALCDSKPVDSMRLAKGDSHETA